jgi:DNA-binding response OmpR family regulator
MNGEFHILIADRNRHVREFLQRELRADGYCVQVARDGREVLLTLNGKHSPDLLILDLDIPYESWPALLGQIRRVAPTTPVVIHTLLTEFVGHPDLREVAAFLEKSGNTDMLKKVVREVLMSRYVARWEVSVSEPNELPENSEETD